MAKNPLVPQLNPLEQPDFTPPAKPGKNVALPASKSAQAAALARLVAILAAQRSRSNP